MSNLRDRLKKISSQRSVPVEAKPLERAACAVVTHVVDAPQLLLQADVLSLLGGEVFANLALTPQELLFIDTETTGLSRGVGTVAFEIGIGEIVGNRMRITQLWMRDYDEEENMLGRLEALFHGKKAIVSFNGKSFDLPLLVSRCTLNRIHSPWRELPHLDLLHPSRRLYKLRLKKCNLSYLEENVLGIYREGDIPGSEIPAIWADFIRTGDERKLTGVLEHNLQDVSTMAHLLHALYAAHDAPTQQLHIEDAFSLGKVYDRAGRYDVAEQCYTSIQAGVYRGAAGCALARIYRKSQRTDDAIKLLEDMIAQNTGGIFPYVELAKVYEHRLRAPQRALHYTDLALAKTMDAQQIQELAHRRGRLVSKIKRKA